jgi:hypothetical protein
MVPHGITSARMELCLRIALVNAPAVVAAAGYKLDPETLVVRYIHDTVRAWDSGAYIEVSGPRILKNGTKSKTVTLRQRWVPRGGAPEWIQKIASAHRPVGFSSLVRSDGNS